MAERRAGVPLASILWILAAVAAWIGVGIRYYRRDEVGWAWAVAGLAFLAMGIAAWNRSRRNASLPGSRDRDPAA